VVFAEIAGHAMTSEGHNLMAPLPDGVGMEKTMRAALDQAGASPDEVDYINAHGTSTPMNDKFETLAIKRLFGPRAGRIPVSSVKSMIGHTAGACGAIEAVVTTMTIFTGVVTPTINYTPDPELDLDYVPHCFRKMSVNVALSNSFGFGGCNATLVFRKYAPAWRSQQDA
jgi:3-oxoacyl-[acyl-carrier-protein] synthase II